MPVISIRRRRVDIRVFVGLMRKLCCSMIENSSSPKTVIPPSNVQMFAGSAAWFGVEKLKVISSA
jgi:hypothetical protein